MPDISTTQRQLEALCASIREFRIDHVPELLYRAPVIDNHHPTGYQQSIVLGLSRFLRSCEQEIEIIKARLASGIVDDRDYSSNAPYLIAVWAACQQARGPLISVAHFLALPRKTGSRREQIKLDIVADGGNEWIKVNTIKESRLRAEFMEQDSYVNSDYEGNSSPNPVKLGDDSRELRNSVICQAESLVAAAQRYPRSDLLPNPRITFVLDRLEEHPERGFDDPRIPATFTAIRNLGINLVFQPPGILQSAPVRCHPELVVTSKIMLDLSVVVALCCDSSHQPLPRNELETEERFRPYNLDERGKRTLAPHVNVTKDLRDQLSTEAEHPLVEELQMRLGTALEVHGGQLEFWITHEVRNRLPALVDTIGGPEEQARAAALLGGGLDFWSGSRYEGKEGVLKGLAVQVLEEDVGSHSTQRASSIFERGVASLCADMLSRHEIAALSAGLPAADIEAAVQSPSRPPRPSKYPRRPKTISQPSKAPSGHTLRTLQAGIRHGMTVLTNNRGAVGKIAREMGVLEGLPVDREESAGWEKAVIWVVNPSSLAEWRRLQVEESNGRLAETTEVG